MEGAGEEGKAAVGVVGEGRGGLAELLDEGEHELEPAQEVEALLALRPPELLERPRRVHGGQELLHQVPVGQVPPRRRL